MSNKSKAQVISGIVILLGIISTLSIKLNIDTWIKIAIVAGSFSIPFLLVGVYIVIQVFAWGILDYIDSVKERINEKNRL